MEEMSVFTEYKYKLAVVGLGTAGIQALAHFLLYTRKEWIIYSISDPKIPILGIGESTNPSFINIMSHGAGLVLHDELFNNELDSTIKYGTMYEKWREKDVINPLIGTAVALHINTFKLKEWALPRFRKMYGDRFKEIHGTVTNLYNEVFKAVAVIDGEEHRFDYIMDCRGFPESYDEYQLVTNPTNMCLVYNDPIPTDPKHTKHIATRDGWMFVVPLRSRTSYGYLFNTSITDEDTAKKNFAEDMGISVQELGNIKYKFKSYFHPNPIQGRIIKNGNRAAFFEPMFANSLVIYDDVNRYSFDYMFNNVSEKESNAILRKRFMDIKQTILFFYHGGSVFDTDFWKHTSVFATKEIRNDPDKRLEKLAVAMQTFNDTNMYAESTDWGFTFRSMLLICEGMGYDYKNGF